MHISKQICLSVQKWLLFIPVILLLLYHIDSLDSDRQMNLLALVKADLYISC